MKPIFDGIRIQIGGEERLVKFSWRGLCLLWDRYGEGYDDAVIKHLSQKNPDEIAFLMAAASDLSEDEFTGAEDWSINEVVQALYVALQHKIAGYEVGDSFRRAFEQQQREAETLASPDDGKKKTWRDRLSIWWSNMRLKTPSRAG